MRNQEAKSSTGNGKHIPGNRGDFHRGRPPLDGCSPVGVQIVQIGTICTSVDAALLKSIPAKVHLPPRR